MSWFSVWAQSVALKDVITIGAASVGAVLGVMNTWNAMNQRRVRLRVTPVFVTTTEVDPLGVAIEVINLSTFPLTVAEVGFSAGGDRRVPVQAPQFSDNKSLPRRVESREAISAMFGPAGFNPPPGVKLGHAYARTACGRTIYGSSPAGRQFSAIMQDIAKGR
jgi:hypothetical protein